MGRRECRRTLKGRVSTHKPTIAALVGQFHVELRIESTREASEDIIRKKIKAAQGADYDTGSNKNGYKPSGDIKKTALSAYSQKEKEGNIGGVVYVTTALPQTTPVDLGGRPMVAAPSDAKKNIKMLDSSKFDGKGSEFKRTDSAQSTGSLPSPGGRSPRPVRASEEESLSKLSVQDDAPAPAPAAAPAAAAEEEEAAPEAQEEAAPAPADDEAPADE
eukprot:Opistho-2@51249